LLEEDPNLTFDQAFKMAPAIVIHGDMIV